MNDLSDHTRRFGSAGKGGDGHEGVARFVGVLSEQRLLIGAIVGVTVALGIAYSVFRPRVYESDALVQVLAQQSGGLSGLVQLSALVQGSALPTQTEIQLIQSRAVVVPVIRKLHLDIRPEYAGIGGLPVIRSILHPDSAPASVSVFDVPPALEDQPFTVEPSGGATYRLLDPGGTLVLNGRIGEPAGATVDTGRGPGVVSIRVDRVNSNADPFLLTHVPMDEAVRNVRLAMSAEEEGDQTGLVDISMRGESVGGIANEVNAIADSNLRQNVRQNSAQAAGELLFLQRQIPEMESRLENSQGKLASFLATRPTVAAFSQSAEYVVQQIGAVEQEMAPLQSQIAEARQLLGSGSPRLQAMEAQSQALQNQHEQLLTKIGKLPKDEQTYVRLQSDVTTNQTLYASMLNQIETLQIAEAGTVGDVVIVDRGIRASKPVDPRPTVAIPLSLIAGLFFGVGGAFLRRSLSQGVEDPEVIDEELSLPVYAMIARSSAERRLDRRRKKGLSKGILAAQSDDATTEALRSLRTAIQIELAKSNARVLSVTSLSPEEGKSFTSSNLAYLFAQSGRRVLLVDGDLRRGHLHRIFGWTRDGGLSDVLRGDAVLEQTLRDTSVPNLHVLTTGTLSKDASSLLMNSEPGRIVKRCAELYDLVVLDLPPVMAVSDAYMLARYANLNLLLLKHGKHSLRQIRMALKRFDQQAIRVHGAVMNDVSTAAQRYAYREYGYQYQYSYK